MRNKKMKKFYPFFSGVMLSAMALSMTACSNSSTKTTEKTTAATTKTEAQTTAGTQAETEKETEKQTEKETANSSEEVTEKETQATEQAQSEFESKEEASTDSASEAESLDPNASYYQVTYHTDGEAEETVNVEAGKRVTEPEAPEKEGYSFNGWYTDEECTEKYVFGYKIEENLELYAGWAVEYTFEAEDVSFAGKSSPVFSGAISGTGMIVPDIYDRGASNGYYVMGLYSQTDATYDTTLEFHIMASEAEDNASLYLRLSGAYMDFSINGNSYQVIVNGTSYNYSDISFSCPDGNDSYSAYMDFEDYLISSSVKLEEGENIIQLVVNNSDSMGGTTRATAPCVDAIKLSVSNGELSWADGFPKTSNYEDE